MSVELEFTLISRPHHGYGRFVHVDANLEDDPEILLYAAPESAYPANVTMDTRILDNVNYVVRRLSRQEIEPLLSSWDSLSRHSLKEIYQTNEGSMFCGTSMSLVVCDGNITGRFDWCLTGDDATLFETIARCLLHLYSECINQG